MFRHPMQDTVQVKQIRVQHSRPSPKALHSTRDGSWQDAALL